MIIFSMLLEIGINVFLPSSAYANQMTIHNTLYLLFLMMAFENVGYKKMIKSIIFYTFLYCILGNYPFIETISIYVIVLVIGKLWRKNILNTVIEKVTLFMSLVLIRELLVLMLRYIYSKGNILVVDNLMNHIVPTLIYSFICSSIILFIFQIISESKMMKNAQKHYKEKIYIIDYIQSKTSKG